MKLLDFRYRFLIGVMDMTVSHSRGTRLYIDYARFIVPALWGMLAAMYVWEGMHGAGAFKYGIAAGCVGLGAVMYYVLQQNYLKMRC